MPATSHPPRSEPSYGLRTWECDLGQMDLPHSHPDIEVNFLRAGRMAYIHGGAWFELRAGQWVAFWAGLPHIVVDSDPGTRLNIITASLEDALAWDLPRSLIGDLLLGKMVREARPAAGQVRQDGLQLRQWLHDLAPEAGDSHRELARREIAARLHRLALQSHARRQPRRGTASAHPAAQRIFDYVSTRFAEVASVEEIAREVGYHPKYLIQTFKKAYGIGLWNYVLRMRIGHAQRLLLTTRLPVTEVALEVGFSTLSAFYRVFGEFTGGRKPSHFRRLRDN